MVEIEELAIGKLFFSLTYFDHALRMPSILSLVYVGEDSEAEEGSPPERLALFQDAGSYAEHGNAVASPERSGIEIYRFPLDSLECIYTWEGLIDELTRNLVAQRESRPFN
jgi:hypothetical protein